MNFFNVIDSLPVPIETINPHQPQTVPTHLILLAPNVKLLVLVLPSEAAGVDSSAPNAGSEAPPEVLRVTLKRHGFEITSGAGLAVQLNRLCKHVVDVHIGWAGGCQKGRLHRHQKGREAQRRGDHFNLKSPHVKFPPVHAQAA